MIKHKIIYDLDAGTVAPVQLDLPRGYEHQLRVKLTKGGVYGYEIPSGGSMQMFFHDNIAIDFVAPDHLIDVMDWVWDAVTQEYVAVFDASVRPLVIIGVGSFFSVIRVTDGGQFDSQIFTSKFLNAGTPTGLSHCSPNDKFTDIPTWFRNWVSEFFRWEAIPGDPAFNLGTLFSFLQVSGAITMSDVAIPKTITSFDPGAMSGNLLTWHVKQIGGAQETVEMSNQVNEDGSIPVIKAPSNDGTHVLTLVVFTP